MTNSVELKTKVTQLLNCPVCLETVKKPKTLTCHHSFCSGCLDNLQNKKECPVCRHKIKKSDKNKADKGLKSLLKIVKNDAEDATKFEDNDLDKVEELVDQFEEMMLPKSKNGPKGILKNKSSVSFAKAEKAGSKGSGGKAGEKVKAKKGGEQVRVDKPKPLSNKDKKVFKDELTPDESSEESSQEEDTTRAESESEDEGTTQDVESSSDSEEESSSDSNDSSSSDDSDSSSSSSSDSSSSDDDDESESNEDSTQEEAQTEEDIHYKNGKKVAIFPDEESFRKNHVYGVVKHKVQIVGIETSVYGVKLNSGTARGLGLKLTKKQQNCLGTKASKWWEQDKSAHMWVEGYRLCEEKLVSDI